MKTVLSARGVIRFICILAIGLSTAACAADCDPVPAGIVAWWQGEHNALDAVGGNNGILENGTGFTAGEVGQAFQFNGVNNFVLVNPPVASNLNIGEGNGLTFEAWINPTTVSAEEVLFSYERALGSFDSTGSDVGLTMAIHADSGGILFANLVDIYNNGHILASPGGLLTPNVWQHVALTYDEASGLAAFYINGTAVTNANFGTFIPQTTYTNFMFGGHTAYNSVAQPGAVYSGAMDEVSLYNRALSAAEIQAIYQAGSAGKCSTPAPPVITAQPTNEAAAVGGSASFTVAAGGTQPLAYQWSFDGTNIDGATNATLTLNDVQMDQSGNYAVLITNAYGSTNSAVSALNVYGLPPVITSQPGNQSIFVGATTSFSVSATGTAPLSYQWSFDGTDITGATNATLTLTDVQLGQSGDYSVQIVNAYGTTNSTPALLTVNALPACMPAPSGIVAWWQGQDNALDAVGGNNGMLMNGTTFTNGKVGAAFDFNGINNYVLVNPATPSGLDIGQGSGLTFEEWIKPNSVSAEEILFTYERILGSYNGADVGTTLAIHAADPGGILFANLVDTNDASHLLTSPAGLLTPNVWQHIALTYDKASGLAALYFDGTAVTVTNLGSFTPQTTFTNFMFGAHTFYGSEAQPSVPFPGAMDEVSLYNRALSSNEIAAIYQAGSAGKCPAPVTIASQPANQAVLEGGTAVFTVVPGGTPPFTYQWSFDGTNIVDATNATLTLANVGFSEAGSYAVEVSNAEGATNSTGAMLTVVTPPFITQQPQSQSVISFGSASFTVAATGTGPLSFQWQFNGTNLIDDGNFIGSTTTNLTIASVSLADAGNYQVLVTSPYAGTNSASAVLTVPETIVSLGSTSAMSGTTITIPVTINALGIESAFAGSVAYDPTKLALQSVLGATPNYNQTNNGYVGFAVFPTTGNTFAPGSNLVAQLVFNTLPVTNNTTVNLAFGNTPVNVQLTDLNFDDLPALYLGGVVQLTPAEYSGDVYPRFNGDHQLTLKDWLEEGRMVAGLDVPTNSDEFLRADAAPRGAPDGLLTVADWVQVGRYALGLDPLTLVTPPPTSNIILKAKPRDGSAPNRILEVATVSARRGQTVSVPVSLVCLTNENAVGLTLSYNPTQLRLLAASPGLALSGGQWNINSNLVGKVGLTLAVSPGMTLPAGTNQIAVLNFAASANASGSALVSLDNSVVRLQTADLLANSLATTYVGGAVVLPPQPSLTATIADGQLQFNWPSAAGTFQVQSASSPVGPWTTLSLPLSTNGASVNCALSSTNQQQYFRLLGQ